MLNKMKTININEIRTLPVGFVYDESYYLLGAIYSSRKSVLLKLFANLRHLPLKVIPARWYSQRETKVRPCYSGTGRGRFW